MKKIYWAIQSLDNAGGTEAVSVNLMNLLCPYYDITLVSNFEFEGKGIHKLDPRIKVECLGLPIEVSRFDQNAGKYGIRHPLKMLKLVHRALWSFYFGVRKNRRRMASLMEEDALYIGSALDSYMFAPRGRKVLFHYHFDGDKFFSFVEKWGRGHSRKPDGWVFLAKSIRDLVLSKKKSLQGKAFYVHNPIKFPLSDKMEYHDNAILFVGRFTAQKDPLLALGVAKELKDRNFPFTLDMYGDGHLEGEMRKFVEENRLDNVRLITGTPTTPEIYQAHDLFLFTSQYEGFGIVKGEANVNNLPVVSSRWKGPIDEVFADPRDGVVISSRDPKDYADAIMKILETKEKALQSKADVHEAAKRLDDEAIVASWRSILDPYFEASKSE
ncbi:MAG: glycosyltransferase family 4 protein [Erysipelotrichaceae bacterium]|jgi:glycosyltransferase involved in cell wall biosynthesis|nr:glycosyltransferase family 4 protein [Erysipelotrichaceae bacterium]